MTRTIFTALVLAALLLCPTARADEGPDFVGDNSAVVLDKMKIARDNLTKSRLADGSNVPAETEQELKTPIIPYADAKRVVNRGMITALARHCGLEWENQSYMPFMKHERAEHRWSDKQIAYIGTLHGVTQGVFFKLLTEKGACDDMKKRTIQAILGGLDK